MRKSKIILTLSRFHEHQTATNLVDFVLLILLYFVDHQSLSY